MEGIEGPRHPGGSGGNEPDLETLEAELEATQARVTELEQKLRLLHQSRTYRVATRMWRIRARFRAPFSRRHRRAPRQLVEPQATAEELEARAAEQLDAEPTAEELQAQATAEELEALAPEGAPHPARGSEVTEQPPSNGDGSELDPAQHAKPVLYYGSRGVRTPDAERSGPLQAVLLMGGMTESELESALRALALEDAVEGEPLVVTDCDALKTLDSAGHLYEYIPPRHDWERHLGRNGDDYDDFVRRRLASIAGMYGLAGVPSIS